MSRARGYEGKGRRPEGEHVADPKHGARLVRASKPGLWGGQFFGKSLGWVGEHVWHAYCVQLDPAEIALFARTGTGVAHCPSSN